MEVSDNSRVPSTDFSIERILGEGPRAPRLTEEGREPTSWLCCTRYRPPKLPRSSGSGSLGGGGGGRGRRAGRHARVPFTAAQAAALEAAYARAPYLAPPALRALAAALALRDDRIKIWFQNRRARERREKTSGVPIAPPGAVALPATATPAHLHWLDLRDTAALRRLSTPDSRVVMFDATTGADGLSDRPDLIEESSMPTPNSDIPFIGFPETRPPSPIVDVETVAEDFDDRSA